MSDEQELKQLRERLIRIEDQVKESNKFLYVLVGELRTGNKTVGDLFKEMERSNKRVDSLLAGVKNAADFQNQLPEDKELFFQRVRDTRLKEI